VASKRAPIPRVRLGGTDLEGATVLVKFPPKRILAGIDGYLGLAALKARRVDFIKRIGCSPQRRRSYAIDLGTYRGFVSTSAVLAISPVTQ
jgi:hypothetical protein